MSQREISRRFHMGRNTVRRIIRQQGKVLRKERNDKILIDPKLLARLYQECNGWVQRMHEKLLEEEHLQVGYSTLTRMVRALDLASNRSGRCDQVADQPGKEMQHDTTNHRVKLGAKRAKVIASLLYLRYSKRRYLKFYFAFNRFAMKCFLHEALMFWKHAADWCIIDNTNLARLSGTGSRAVIVPEMAAFAERYGFQFLCHELGHANRKAGNERSFRTVETSFLPGREFQSLEDMNQQAFDWATQRMENRSQTKRRLIPAKVFEYERPYLKEVPPHLPAPYQVHERGTDQYGYVAFAANYYWVPGTGREREQLGAGSLVAHGREAHDDRRDAQHRQERRERQQEPPARQATQGAAAEDRRDEQARRDGEGGMSVPRLAEVRDRESDGRDRQGEREHGVGHEQQADGLGGPDRQREEADQRQRAPIHREDAFLEAQVQLLGPGRQRQALDEA